MLLLCFLFFIIITSPLQAQVPSIHTTTEHYYCHSNGEHIYFHLGDSSHAPLLVLPLDGSVLTAALSKPKVRETYGFFKFKESFQKQCKKSQIQQIQPSEKQVLIKGQLCEEEFYILIKVIAPQSIQVQVSTESNAYNRLYFKYGAAEREALFGLGEQYTHSNLEGKRVPIWVEEQGIGAGDQPITTVANVQIAGGTPVSTYAPIPFYLSTTGHSFFLENSCRAVFDFRPKKYHQLTVWQGHFQLTLRQNPDPLALIKAQAATMGKQPLLPDWAFGTVVGLQGGREKVLGYLDSLEAVGTPIAAIWIQDWVGRRRTFVGDQLRWYWEADEQRYPDFKNFCAQLKERGIAVLGYINPMLTNDGPLYTEADEKGYLVKNEEGETYVIRMTGFDVGLVDLTNPMACTWMKNIIKNNMLAYGLSGWMADFGEALPWDAVLHDGTSPECYHNQYPVDWARINREAIEEAGKLGEVAFFSRSAFSGSSQYATLFWAGDQMTSWQKNDGLRSIIPALTSSGITGMALNHADVGGFAGFWKVGGLFQMRRTKKLLKRHIELGALTPVFRTHEGILPKKNAQVYDAEIRDFYAYFAQLHAQLKPYLKELNLQASQEGYPMIRHLYLHYPKDKEAQKAVYQFLLGKDVLVAPNVRQHAKKVKVYLPAGNWIHWFSQKVYKGGQYYTIPAPLGKPPVFFLEGGSFQLPAPK